MENKKELTMKEKEKYQKIYNNAYVKLDDVITLMKEYAKSTQTKHAKIVEEYNKADQHKKLELFRDHSKILGVLEELPNIVGLIFDSFTKNKIHSVIMEKQGDKVVRLAEGVME
jgi:hypothetical protein